MTTLSLDPGRADQARARFREIAERAQSGIRPQASDFLFSRHRIFYAPNKGVAEIADAVVLSGEWFVLTNDLVICDAFTQTPFPPFSAYHMGMMQPGRIDFAYPSPVRLDVPRAFLLGGCPNYSHWLMDFLPRLSLWKADAPLLTNRCLPFQLEGLRALGIGGDQLIQVEYPSACIVPSLLFASLNSAWAAAPPRSFQPEIIAWLRSKFAFLFDQRAARRRLFVTRAGERTPSGRRLLNNDEILDVARRYDFEIVSCETLPFAEQVKLFSQAQAIAGPHGAGLVNMVFAPAGARLIELMGPRGSDPTTERAAYRQVAGMMNMGFSRVVGRADAGAVLENDHLVNEKFSIDPREFAASLERL